jgi:mRNA-degrading endonuclease RelE of RelBE toxin-antitoxin system
MNKSKLSKISNDYNLKAIFSFLDSQYLLKLIQKNKEIQNKLGVNLENYKIYSNYPKYQFSTKKKTTEYQLPYYFTGDAVLGHFAILLCLHCLHFTYVLIYAILLVSKVSFNNTSGLNENFESSAKFIYVINICLFLLVLGDLLSTILLFYYGGKERDMRFRYGLKRLIKIILIIVYDSIYIIFEVLVIWKLVLSYKIKEDGEIWYIVLDYIFLFFHLLYMAYILHLSYIYFKYYLNHFTTETIYNIVSLNNIRIENYNVSKDFSNMSERDRKAFLLNNYKNIEYKNTLDQHYLIKIINEYRENNNLPKLLKDKLRKIPDFMMNEPAEIMINPKQHIFKLSDNKYLFKYPVGEFEIIFKNRDINILAILSNENLNYIKIITKNNFEYIFISKLSYLESYKENI